MNINETSNLPFLKIIICGGQGVGKTTFSKTFGGESFNSSYCCNDYLEHFTVTHIQYGRHNNPSDNIIKLLFWVLGGKESEAMKVSSNFHGCAGIILMYDLTNKKSLKNVCTWVEIIKDVFQTRERELEQIAQNKAEREKQKSKKVGKLKEELKVQVEKEKYNILLVGTHVDLNNKIRVSKKEIDDLLDHCKTEMNMNCLSVNLCAKEKDQVQKAMELFVNMILSPKKVKLDKKKRQDCFSSCISVFRGLGKFFNVFKKKRDFDPFIIQPEKRLQMKRFTQNYIEKMMKTGKKKEDNTKSSSNNQEEVESERKMSDNSIINENGEIEILEYNGSKKLKNFNGSEEFDSPSKLGGFLKKLNNQTKNEIKEMETKVVLKESDRSRFDDMLNDSQNTLEKDNDDLEKWNEKKKKELEEMKRQFSENK